MISTTTPTVTLTPLMMAPPLGPTLCVLCEQETLVPLRWQDGASACCRHCFRSHRKQIAR
jgi:hypothetical protein